MDSTNKEKLIMVKLVKEIKRLKKRLNENIEATNILTDLLDEHLKKHRRNK